MSKDLLKARAELKAYSVHADKTLATIKKLKKSSVGYVESAMRELKKELKTTTDACLL